MKQLTAPLPVIKTVLYSLLLVTRIQLSCGWIFLANSDQEQINAAKPSPYYRGTVTEDGVTYEYEYANGKEVLHVLGKLPMNFDQEKVMGTFRTNLGVDGSAPKHDGVQRQSIFESFGAILSDVKHSLYNNLSPSSEIDEQIDQAREELNEIDDELSRVLTQQLVLRKRQADLGIYIEKTLKATAADRNPTVEELVLTEDDRLTLVEHRLKRIKEKLLKQKEQIENFLKYHENDQAKSNEHAQERHIFTHDYEQTLPVRVIAKDEE
jgi:hypothetical protein